MAYGRAATRSAAATGNSIHGVVVRYPRRSPGMVGQGNKQRNEVSRSSKGESEKSATKPARQAKNGPVAGVEHQHGNRTTRALLDSDASGRGRPLEAGVRKTMETAFHEDFSPVRVHTPENVPRGVEAAASGRHIVFGRGQYAPHSERGKRLIAHELAHVVQQSRSGRGGN